MDKIKEFDKGLRSINPNAYLMSNVMKYLMCGIGIMLFLIPVGKTYIHRDFWQPVAYAGFLCGMGEWFYIMNYQRVQEDRQLVSLYKKLRYMPVSKAQIRKVRYGYLNRFCCKLGLAAFILQETVSYFNHSLGLLSVLAVLVWVVWMWVFGIVCIYIS